MNPYARHPEDGLRYPPPLSHRTVIFFLILLILAAISADQHRQDQANQRMAEQWASMEVCADEL